MPFGRKIECVKCGITNCYMWTKIPDGQLCNDCFSGKDNKNENTVTGLLSKSDESKIADCQVPSVTADCNSQSSTNSTAQSLNSQNSCNVSEVNPAAGPRVTRNYKTRNNAVTSQKNATRGRGRRSIFKKPPVKAPSAVATPVTSDYVFFKGNYYQVGDIVSVRDIDGGLYYAQIRGFLTDQYCEKSCVLTWLLPTNTSPPPEEGFDPSTYIIGPEEDIPRRLAYMEFVMHAPSDYFMDHTTPYPSIYGSKRDVKYIWTRLPKLSWRKLEDDYEPRKNFLDIIDETE